MAMFISPKYNVGEKVAGGTLTIYKDETMQVLVPLWCYHDLTEAEDGSGRIANPVPVDNNGIDSSPVFYDETTNPKAYYVLKDARGAVIRQGFVYPASWMGGGTPPVIDNPFDSMPDGDQFWGYEVVASISVLNAKDPIPGRPVYLDVLGNKGNGGNASNAGDKSGGLIVWAVPNPTGATGDNVITFGSSDASMIWKAREKVLNYSYLANRTNGQDPFTFLEVNYPSEYDINLDVAPSIGGSNIIGFMGKVIIEQRLTGSTSTSSLPRISLSDPSKLEIRVKTPFSNNATLLFNVKGGSWDSGYVFDSNGLCILTGHIDKLHLGNANTKYSFNGVRIDELSGAVPANLAFTSPNNVPSSVRTIHILGDAKATDLQNIPALQKIVVSNTAGVTIDLNGSNGFPWQVEGVLGAISLTDSANDNNAYYVKPSERLYFDNTFYAKNVEFYNEAKANAQIGPTNPHVIGSQAAGDLILNENNTGKLEVSSSCVNISSFGCYSRLAYLRECNKANECQLRILTKRRNANNELYIYAKEINHCNVQPDSTGDTGSLDMSLDIRIQVRESHGSSYSSNRAKLCFYESALKGCTFYGAPDGSTPTSSDNAWMYGVELANDTTIEGSAFKNMLVLFNSRTTSAIRKLRNIKFNNNKAWGYVFLIMPTHESLSAMNNEYANYWYFENFEIKANASPNELFIPVASSGFIGDGTDNGTGTSPTDKWMKGHIEITGHYDLSNCLAQIATNVFPDQDATNGDENPWNGGGESIANLCMYVFGDPLKFTDAKTGTFVTVDPWITTNSTQENITPMSKEEIINSLTGFGWIYAGEFTPPFNPNWGYAFGDNYTNGNLAGRNGITNIADLQSLLSAGLSENFNTSSGDSVYNALTSLLGTTPNNNENYFITYTNPDPNYSNEVWLCLCVGKGNGTFVCIHTEIIGDNPDLLFTIEGGTGGAEVIEGNGYYDNHNPIPRTNYVYGISESGTGTNSDDSSYTYQWFDTKIVKCLLCCEGNVKLYRIRE